jgi:outer membrane protein OmpA-like peptidoglycan-associated protein
MKALRTPLSNRLFLVLLSALVLCISSCGFPTNHPQGMRTLFLPPIRASALVVITNPGSPSAMRATEALIAASERPRQRVLILSSLSGATLASSQAPNSPSIRVPAPPAPLSSHPTSFQRAHYSQAVGHYQDVVLRAQAALWRQQQQELAAWAKSTVAEADARPILQRTRTVSISTDLGAVVSDLSSLRQAGLGVVNVVIVIVGITSTIAPAAPESLTGLQGSTVVVDDFPGTTNEEFAWQASLVQGGAARAVVLTPATDDQLISVVQQGLDGAVTDTLTSVLFGLGQYKLQAAALAQLRQLQRLLTVEYPHATASINGYTDNLPVPGGNLQLSRQRAQEIEQWLIAHGIEAGRLQSFGYGDTDPVASNTPTGQPLNRRVVVVIDPAVSA